MRKRNHDGDETPNIASIACLVEGGAFEKAVKKVPQEYWSRSEDELRELAKPSQTDYALRVAFWNEVRHSEQDKIPIKPHRIYQGICSYANWHQNVLSAPAKLAWLLHPLRNYEKCLEPLLVVMAQRYWEIIQLPIYDDKGNVMVSSAKLILQLGKQIEDRLLGSSVQRVASQTVQIHGHPNESKIGMRPGENGITYMERLQREIKELDREERELMHLPPNEN